MFLNIVSLQPPVEAQEERLVCFVRIYEPEVNFEVRIIGLGICLHRFEKRVEIRADARALHEPCRLTL